MVIEARVNKENRANGLSFGCLERSEILLVNLRSQRGAVLSHLEPMKETLRGQGVEVPPREMGPPDNSMAREGKLSMFHWSHVFLNHKSKVFALLLKWNLYFAANILVPSGEESALER